jgi:ABC-type polysaccharide/polyol phosphate transport system ATPase subunit
VVNWKLIRAENISKLYRLYEGPGERLKEAAGLGRGRGRDFWALRGVSFEAVRGEVFGVVGPNGSGKSTLLQVVSGVIQPTSGRVEASGRVAALLELGAGFNPEFTGRENARLQCELQGFWGQELEERVEAIEGFAGVGEYFDRPCREYSSGMYVRVAFSAAIHVDPDVLIVDEALAVGDALFSSKCVRRLEEMKRAGKTMLFVSHDLGLVRQLCDRGMLLWKGEVAALGEAAEVCGKYVAVAQSPEAPEVELARREAEHGDRRASVVRVAMVGGSGEGSVFEGGERIRVVVEVKFHEAAEDPFVGILIRTRKGMDVFGTNTRVEGLELGRVEAGEMVGLEFGMRCRLARGEYTLTVAAQRQDGKSMHWADDLMVFRVAESRDLAGVADLSEGVRRL